MPNITFKKALASDGKYYDVNFTHVAGPVIVPPPVVDPAPTAPVEQPPVDAPVSSGSIPLSKDDLRFKINTPGPTGILKRGALTNVTWDHSPGYKSGEPCFTWGGNGNDVLTIDKALIDCREGPRIGADSTPRATLNITNSFINCVGKGEDHADGTQAYSPGGIGTVNVRSTCYRSYSDAEARSKYGSGFIGSCGFFWADEMEGDVNFEDVVVWGGGRGVAIYADKGGDTVVSFKRVFFVPGPDGWTAWPFDIRGAGGKLTIKDWDVFEATIKDGKLIPGKSIPKP